ncbi:hypothetical protein HDU87_005972 [Geranomyces variabilis]|uniref:Uncharacterized protein n=1 Tax=Geranomyces variabilis TaxID=109894 RepID=A0AAD5TT26_9FUNG|nr:hypothetical protein HDU87_005972 [Geranomyces variabilis]
MAGTLFYQENLIKAVDMHSDLILHPHEILLQRWAAVGPVYFIGDSVTRYQFLELVYYLETGLVPSTNNTSTLIDALHDPTNESTFESWAAFYLGTSQFAQGRLTCDCHRTPNSTMEEVIENRVYTNRNVKLVYVQYFKDIGVCSIRGRTLAFQLPNSSPTPDWCLRLPTFVKSLLNDDSANSITVVLNSGLHGYSVETEVLEVILDMFQNTTGNAKAESSNINLLIWKTTTPSQGGSPAPNVIFPHTWEDSRHSQVFDAAGIIDTHFANQSRADLYWDKLHFIGDVYHALNSELIAFIEDAKTQLI